jgi:hypothetical protein
MIKIERLSKLGLATIVRKGTKMRVFPSMPVTSEELATLQVERGEVTYSIHEQEVVTVKAKEPEVTPVVETPKTASPAPANKKIVFPESSKVMS